MNISNLLENGIKELKNNNIDEANLKVKMLLSNILDVPKEYLIIHNNDEVEENIVIDFQNKIEELKNGKPIQYIICKQEFMGLNFYVNENVLIPQPDTEILAEEALDIIKLNKMNKVLDICTGSGAIGISIAKMYNLKNVVLADISKEALEVAKINAEKNMVDVKFILSDMFKNIEEKFDIIVSNPPYIEDDIIKSLPVEVQNEPYIALSGGKDGLDFYRIIAKESKNYLNENGYVAVEIGFNQKEDVINIFQNENYKDVYSKKDFGGNDRIVVARV